jgi:hypothetical protein
VKNMIAPGTFVYDVFRPLGSPGLLLALFLIFYLDATVVPTFPEFFTALIYLAHPGILFAVMMLAVLSAGEFLGISTLYFAVLHADIPEWLSGRMKRYTSFFVLGDERMILMNRITPVIPYLGAFIATCNWSFRRSVFYNFIGGIAKYTAIILLATIFLTVFSNALLADSAVLIAVIILIVISWTYSLVKRRA